MMSWYLKGFIKGLFLWIPFMVVCLIIPIIGWIMLPIVPVFPFIYPFIEKRVKEKELLKKAKKELVLAEYEELEKKRSK